MGGCFTPILVIIGGIIVLISLIRWYEQATEAVELGWWNKVFVLLAMPFTVWFFPSKVAAGRPTPVPHHEPVRGFGSMPKAPVESGAAKTFEAPKSATVPPKKGKSRIDPAQIAKLKEKMRQQGMLPEDEEKAE